MVTFTFLVDTGNKTIVNNHYKKYVVNKHVGSELNEQRFKDFLLKAEINYPEIVYAQAMLESNLTSKLAKEQNNLFGMKFPRQRPTTAIKNERGFAKYLTWEDAVLDYRIYQKLYLPADSPAEYYQALINAGYARDPDYISKLKAVAKKFYND